MKNIFHLLLLSSLLLLSACQLSPQPSARVRAFAEVKGETLSVRVTLEGADGQSLSGANVGLVDPAGAWRPLPFSGAKNGYAAELAALAGMYELELSSSAAGEKQLRFPVTPLGGAPELLLVRDGRGGDAKAFTALQVSAPINLSWAASEGAQRYLVELRQGGATVFSEVTNETSLTLPAKLLTTPESGSSATVQVTAERSAGDRRFQEADYFSVSSLAGGTFTFQVVP